VHAPPAATNDDAEVHGGGGASVFDVQMRAMMYSLSRRHALLACLLAYTLIDRCNLPLHAR